MDKVDRATVRHQSGETVEVKNEDVERIRDIILVLQNHISLINNNLAYEVSENLEFKL